MKNNTKDNHRGRVPIKTDYCSVLFWAAGAFFAGRFFPFAFLSLLLHELGHLAAAVLCREQIEYVVLLPFGLRIFSRNPGKRFQEAAVALSGPAVNLTAALLARLCSDSDAARLFALVNLIPALFNLLPLRLLDGGTVLASLLGSFCKPQSIDKICGAVSAAVLFLLWTAAVYLLLTRGEGASFLFLCFYLFAELFTFR